MKDFLVSILMLAGCSAAAQSSYFVKNDGTKVITDDKSLNIILIDKRVSYSLPGKEWEKYIKFDDLDYVINGPYYFKSFKLDGSKKSSCYFVLAETDEKKLLAIPVTTITNTGKSSYSSTTIFYRVVSNDNITLTDGSVKVSDREKHMEYKLSAINTVKSHFKDCPAVISRLESLDTDANKMDVLEFFLTPVYTKCN